MSLKAISDWYSEPKIKDYHNEVTKQIEHRFVRFRPGEITSIFILPDNPLVHIAMDNDWNVIGISFY